MTPDKIKSSVHEPGTTDVSSESEAPQEGAGEPGGPTLGGTAIGGQVELADDGAPLIDGTDTEKAPAEMPLSIRSAIAEMRHYLRPRP